VTELLLLVGVAVLVAANAFFVGAEFALVRARDAKLEALEKEGKRGASLAGVQLERIDEYLSACQLGITMASLGIGFMGEPAIGSLLEDMLGDSLSHEVTLAISLAFAYLLTTALHITVGEQVPKIYAITHAEGVARRSARLLEAFRVTFKPLIWALNTTSNGILRAVGVNPKAEFEEISSADDLKMIIARSATGGKLDPGEAGMLRGVFHLHEQEARQVMTPIPAVVTVDVSETAEAALRRCVDSGHTRLVVTEDGNDDKIRGIVHNNSLARRLMNEGPGASIEPSVKDAFIVPETKPLDDLPGSSRSRTSSRRSSARSPTRRTRPSRASGGSPTATGGCAATSRSPTSPTTAWTCRSTPTPTTPSAGSSSGSWGACPSAATWCAPTATRCGSSRCARTGSRRCASVTTRTARLGARWETPRCRPRSSRARPPRAPDSVRRRAYRRGCVCGA
jgi:CBS domain containing-hemolysin-like protein